MKKIESYIKIIDLSFQNQMEYKMNFFLSFLFQLIPFIVNILLWLAITTTGTFSMTRSEIITYYAICLITSNLVVCSIQNEVSDDIRNGTINKYLIKPVNYFGYQLMKDFSSRIIFILLGCIPIAGVFFALNNIIEYQFDIIYLMLYIVALVVGYAINFLITFLLSELCFYFTNVSTFFSATTVLKSIVSGSIFPLALLPIGLVNSLQLLPFSYIVYFPTVILQQQYTVTETIRLLCIGMLWFLLLANLCKLTWSKGLEKYSSFGG